MAKMKDSQIKDFSISVYEDTKRIEKANIAELNTDNMKIYGANVNLARAFPDVHDGLKLVERRIIYTMYFLAKAIKKNVKSLVAIGQCSNIHAHGDASIYGTMVRIAQEWNMLIPYIKSTGGFGTISGEPASASRYTEVRLSEYSLDCFMSEWSDKIVLMQDTYNRDVREPVYLPCKYPNCLLSASDGMGFGHATHIPTFNFEEVIQATIKLIEDPNYEPVLIPDITTGCLVIDEGNFPEICKTGRGTFKMRAEIYKDAEKKCLIVRSIPFQVSLLDVKQKIRELVESKIIVGFKDMKDYSADKIHLELYFKPEVDLENIISILYTKTGLQDTYPVQLKMVDDYAIVQFSVKTALLRWIESRYQFKRKLSINKLVTLEQRNHILEVLIRILDGKNAEKTMTIIKNSNREQIIEKLVKEYNITTLQASQISLMRLNAFNKDARAEYIKELKDNQDEIKKLNKIIKSRSAIFEIIIKELEEGIKKYAAPRRSRVIKLEKEYKYSDYECKILFTKNGYIKKLKNSTKYIGQLGNTDEPIDMIVCNNRDEIIVFDKRGVIHTFEIGAIANDDLNTIGTQLSTYINISGAPISIFNRKNIQPDTQFIFITKNGVIKKTTADNFGFKNSVIAINIRPDDELVKVICTNSDEEVFVYSRYGYGIRFNTSEIPSSKRLSIGVNAFNLSEKDYVVGVEEITKDNKFLVIITQNGYTKKCSTDIFGSKKRGSEPVKFMPVMIKDSIYTVMNCNDNDNISVLLMKKGLYTLNVMELPTLLKIEHGEKIIPVTKTDLIISVTKNK